MNERSEPERGGPESARLDNGLRAPTYVPLTDVDADVGQHLLTALGRARIAAYLDPAAAPDIDQRRLFVASEERVDARTIVRSTVRALGTEQPELPDHADPLDGLDAKSVFDALVADWHVDTVAAVREAERDLTREDAEWRSRLNNPQASDEVWLDEDHYIPPPPPPLPRFAAPTIIAMSVLAISIILLGLGGQFGLASGFTLVLGVAGLLLAAGILLSRVREHQRDEDDDGSAV
ncbi:MAG: hypothetical protein QOG01_4839 [Pseudonocardiales bacterium]|nr:hypothetical protein [Pseudonocardiales bacterium]